MTAAVALLLLAAPIAGDALALNPTDDDAGSGRDAGDEPATAVPIAPGTHEGRVTETIDTRDHYSFHADEGDVVVVTVPDGGPRLWVGLVGPEGQRHAYDADHEGAWVPIPETGTWSVLIEMTGASNQLPAAAVAYTFELERSQDHHVHERTVEDGWYTAEVALEEPGRVMGYVRGSAPQDPGEAYGNFGAIASWKAKTGGGESAGWSAHAYGHGAAAGASPFAIASEVLPGDEAAQVSSFSPWSTGEILEGYTEAQMRVTALEAPSGHGLRVAIASSSPFDVREAAGSEVVHWTTSDNEEQTVVRAGGVVATEAANLTVPTDHGLRGQFYTYDAGGEIATPDGDCHDVGHGELFADPRAGSWEFRLNPVQDVGYTEHVYLVAADVPRLGAFDWGGDDPLSQVRGPPCGPGTAG